MNLLHRGVRSEIYQGDALEILQQLPAESVHCCISSPPYWALRDYGTAEWKGGDAECDHEAPDEAGHTDKPSAGQRQHAGRFAGPSCYKCGARRIDQQLGLEKTPEEYVKKMVTVFRAVRRVLRPDGTLWLNLGDSYCSQPSAMQNPRSYRRDRRPREDMDKRAPGLKLKDLCGIPWRVAFALQANGWYLRSDIIWAKPNPMPESTKDRPTKAHEYVFLMAKSHKYFYDADAIREPAVCGDHNRNQDSPYTAPGQPTHTGLHRAGPTPEPSGRNKRTVWTIATQPYAEAHFATFPEALVEPCILAGTSARGCCSECGKPWVRQMERFDTGKTQKMADGWAIHEGGHGSFHKDGREKGESGKPMFGTRTVGWSPSCACPIYEAHVQDIREIPPSACTVLDPFCGSGTAGLVAIRLDRHFIGIDLSEKYLTDLAIPRIRREEAKPVQQELW